MYTEKVREKLGEIADLLRDSQPTALMLVILLLVVGFVLVVLFDGYFKKRKWRGQARLRARQSRRR